ncbi:MAG: hypothetical protein H6606_11310 [Flavobacteriales bacterium]|nr:hypothetical protein [Flavobacteriales bacterium]
MYDLVQRNEIIGLLENAKSRAFISENLHSDPVDLSLNTSKHELFDLPGAIRLIDLYQKAQSKLPLWVENMLALDRRSLEQCTAQAVSEWRCSIFSGRSLLELTGGLGVDTTFLSRSFEQVRSMELNAFLNDLARYNDIKLGLGNVERMTKDASAWKAFHPGKHTTVFIDPDRRPGSDRRVFGLRESSPPIMNWLPEMMESSERVLIKCSPMEDVQALLRNVPGIRTLYCVSLHNEMKEILLEIRSGNTEPELVAVEIDRSGTHTIASSDMPEVESEGVGEVLFVLEPSTAIRKAGLAHSYAGRFGLKPLHPEGTYFGSDRLPEQFVGRIWSIELQGKLNWKELKRIMKLREIDRIHVLRKHFPMSAEAVRKKLSVQEGGSTFLIILLDKEREGRFYLGKAI